MAFTPSTTVYLLDTPLDIKYDHTLRFSTRSAQTDYFLSRLKHTFSNVTYQRKNNVVRVAMHIDSLWDVNYCMYQNSNFSTRWFYAFITKMEYVSDMATDIYIETDVYQTWMMDCTFHPSFVVREHVADDTIGANLVDEQLETGEYITGGYGPVNQLGTNWNIVAVSDITATSGGTIGNIYGNVVTGLLYFPFQNNTDGVNWLKSFIADYTNDGKMDAIQMIFTVPYLCIEPAIGVGTGWTLGQPIPSNTFYGYANFNLASVPTTIDGYTPKNNKMFTYPYCMFYVSNATGQSAEYRYEHFSTSTLGFSIVGAISPNPVLMMYPRNYKGASLSYEHGLALQGFPLAGWTTDTYTAWLAQNSAQMGITLAGSGVAIVGGLATGNVPAIIGGVLGVGANIAQITKASIQPDQAHGHVASGISRYAEGTLDYYYSKLNIMSEYAQRIDNFFTMYGYKVNALKVPEFYSRVNWNYIKTVDANITGPIPTDDMNKLKSIFDNGVTLWHNWATFQNYSAINTIR